MEHEENIENLIYRIRGHKVMLDRDLAAMYGVETRRLNQAVKRNIERFPEDFMFQLTNEEVENWKSQIVTSNLKSQNVIPDSIKMGLRKNPYAFTELGVSILAGAALQAAPQIFIIIQSANFRFSFGNLPESGITGKI